MHLFEVVEYANKHNIKLSIANENLQVSGNEQLLSAEFVAALKAHKPALMAHLADSSQARILPAAPQALYPLSFAQRRLYFLYQYDPSITHFNLPAELVLQGDFDASACEAALQMVLQQHAIYRTRYVLREGVAYQTVAENAVVALTYLDLSTLLDAERQASLQLQRRRLSETPFDLEHEMPLRSCLLKLAQDCHVMLVVFHHIATDEWSIRQFIGAVTHAYNSLRRGEVIQLEAAPISYCDYAAWQDSRYRNGGYNVARSYWQQQLKGVPECLELPLDKARPPLQSFSEGERRRRLEPATVAAVSGLARTFGCSEYAVLLGAYFLLLNKLTGACDMVVGADVFGRDNDSLSKVAGFFVNQLALRGTVQPASSVAEHLQAVNQMVVQALSYQDMPFDKVIEDLRVERNPAYSPLFQVKFLYQKRGLELDLFEGVKTVSQQSFAAKSQYDLTFKVVGDEVQAYYNSDLFDASTIDRWLHVYMSLLAESLAAPQRAIADLLQEHLRVQMLAHSQGGEVAVANSVWAQLESCMLEAADRIAVVGVGESITYADLRKKSIAVAAQLHKMGIQKGDKVGVYLDRSISLVVAMLGIWRVGAVLVPLDTSYPAEQVEYMLSDSDLSLVISDEKNSDNLQATYAVVLPIEQIAGEADTGAALDWPSLDGDDLAYLLYTSGSSGVPKGVLVRHGALANLCDWYIRFAEMQEQSRVLLIIPVGFDASIKNILTPLMTGAQLVLGATGHFDAGAILAQIRELGVTIINSAPSALYALLAQDAAREFASLTSLRFLALGGEALKLEMLRPWLAHPNCHAELANIYGPTECADISVAHKASAREWLDCEHVLIGRPIQNTQAFVVDADGKLCIQGVTGELLLAGANVGAGYHHKPAETAAAFIHSDLASGSVYRTGDYCRHDKDGNIRYVERRDGQIKIRGKRVEAAEIIYHITRLVPVRNISVQLHKKEGLEMLLAFLELEEASAALPTLRNELASVLPRHMVPAQIIAVERMPLTPNGKVCRQSLLGLFERQRMLQNTDCSLFSEEERLVQSIWLSILGTSDIGRQSDFFALGGDSILSIQLVAELKNHGVDVAVADVFKFPTLEGLALHIAGSRERQCTSTVATLPPFALLTAADRALLPGQLEDAYPATTLQRGMLFHRLLQPTSRVYHDVISLTLALEFDEPLLREAIQKIVDLHPVLRTGFDLGRYSVPMQLVYGNVGANVLFEDISNCHSERQAHVIAAHKERIEATGCPMAGPSLIRFVVLKLASDQVHLLIDAHHAILDGWSMATLQRQMLEYYLFLRTGRPLSDVFDAGDERFADYVALLNEDEQSPAGAHFWSAYCAGKARGAVAPALQRADAIQMRSIDIDAVRLAELTSRTGLPLPTLTLMAHAYMVKAVVGHVHIVTGVTDNGRLEVRGAQNMAGLFLNVLPFRINLAGRSWREIGQLVQEDNVTRKPYRRHPFASIVQASPDLVIDTLFSFTNFHVAKKIVAAEEIGVSNLEHFEETDFALSTTVNGNLADGLKVILTSKLDLPEEHLDVLLHEFVLALAAMTDDCDRHAAPRWAPYLESGDGTFGLQLRYRGQYDEQALNAALARYRWHAVMAGRSDFDGDAMGAPTLIRGVSCLPAPDRKQALTCLSYSDGAWEFLSLHAKAEGNIQQRADTLAMIMLSALDTPTAEVGLGGNGEWCNVIELNEVLPYWQQMLEDAPLQLVLPSDRARPADDYSRASGVAIALPATVVAGVQHLADRHQLGLASVLCAAWGVFLCRLANQDDLVFGVDREGGAANFMPLRLRFDATTTVATLLAQLRGWEPMLMRCRGLPLRKFAAAFLPDENTIDALCRVTFAYGPAREQTTHAGDLSLSLAERGGMVAGHLMYADALFDRETVEDRRDQFLALLAAFVQDESTSIHRLPMLAEQQWQRLRSVNETARSYPQHQLIHELFEAQAQAQPAVVALRFGEQELSYGELNERANRLAHYLRSLGVAPDARVALCVERGVEMVVALLAILKAGGAYVPLDPAYPADRLAHMLSDSAPVALLTLQVLQASLPPVAVPVLLLDDAAPLLATQPAHNPAAEAMGLAAGHLAYVIYTSGSTGLPKGVGVPHCSVTNFLHSMREAPGMNSQDTILSVTSPSFDIAALEIYLPLMTGARLVLASTTHVHTPRLLAALMRDAGVTVMQATPSLWRTVLEHGWPELGRKLKILCGGEALPPDLQRRLGTVAELWNMYGPTETTIWSTICQLGSRDRASIGRPIANTQVYVLDAQMQAVPPGVTGELYIGGAGVARGYLNRPELTAERFVANPFGTGRLYRTGDLARWLRDGSLEFLGRADFQVKVRGFRIELGEIEARLNEYPGVRQAVLIAREAGGMQQLLAYMVPEAGVTLEPAVLRAALAAQLPEYMLPSAFVTLEAFPLTPNGKLDRRALPAPDSDALPMRRYEAPQGALEEGVAALWRELLGVPQVGREDNFFALGGHSLLAMQLVARVMQQWQVELSLRALFAQPTLGALAAQVAAAGGSKMLPLAPVDRSQALPLSWAQQRLWFLDQLDHASGAAYHMPAALRLQGKIDRKALKEALDSIVARHESLRTSFVMQQGAAVQSIAPPGCGFALQEQDLRNNPSGWEAIAAAEARQLFELDRGPLVRCRLLQLGEQEHVLLVTQHHIISDGWSIGVLVRELSTLYSAFSQGQPDPLPALPLQYADYAHWQRQWLQGSVLEEQLAFWRGHLAGAPALLELPVDRSRPAVQSYGGGSIALRLSEQLTAVLRQLAQDQGVTLFMVLLGGWSLLLSRLSGQPDVVIGTPVANRQRPEVEGLIGFFVNTLAMRVSLADDLNVAALLAQVKANAIEAYSHQDVPFEQVVEALRPVRSMSHSPLFQAMLTLNNMSAIPELALPGLTLSDVTPEQVMAQFDISLSLEESGNVLVGAITYASDLFDRSTVTRWAGHLETLLWSMAEQPSRALCELAMLSEAERRALLVGARAVTPAVPLERCYVELFAEQAALHPEALAAVCGMESLTYRELDRRSNRIAHALTAAGVGRDCVVVLFGERSLMLQAMMIGVLKAGGAFLSLEISQPVERLRSILQASQAGVALIARDSAAWFAQVTEAILPGLQVLLADGVWQDGNDGALESRSGPRDLAYVISTSGTTGVPKGAMVEQRGMLNNILGKVPTIGLSRNDRVAQTASPAFDISVWQFLGAPVVGGTVYILEDAIVQDPWRLAKAVQERGITVLEAVPSLLRSLLDQPDVPTLPSLRWVLPTGEALPLKLAQDWFAHFPQVSLMNVYGPAECSDDVSYFALTEMPADGAVIPIGRATPNNLLYLVDQHLRLVPPGVVGEICVGGAGVGRGYLHRPELTAERFITDPFS
ncbi:non-ribosomal peptide synthetase, partial [Massilia sp. BJB1822]|uniref:non-ribosomal peptide synthetase n=1 Tax=Massilia sp. BJB1822 TaxID=2744470 RepID=UPI001594310C